jgi:hypothetical protein
MNRQQTAMAMADAHNLFIRRVTHMFYQRAQTEGGRTVSHRDCFWEAYYG